MSYVFFDFRVHLRLKSTSLLKLQRVWVCSLIDSVYWQLFLATTC